MAARYSRDLRWGVYVTFSAEHEYVRRCFQEYGIVTDPSGEYASMYKPSHLIGLELGISVASVALRGEATGCADAWRADCVATAKRALKSGETLDGEGGYTVWGRLMSAGESASKRALPIGLAHHVKMKRDVAEGAAVDVGRRRIRRAIAGGEVPARYGAGVRSAGRGRRPRGATRRGAREMKRFLLAFLLSATVPALAAVTATDAWGARHRSCADQHRRIPHAAK